MRDIKHAVAAGLWAFLLCALAGLFSQTVVTEISIVWLAFLLLLAVVSVGIVFDIVGVAAMSAGESALHSRASNRVFGARQAVRLVKNSSKVASLCNDVVGDVCGTLGGAIGVSILFKILVAPSHHVSVWSAALITALVAAMAVGGKAFGKTFAVEKSIEIILFVGRCIAFMEKLSPARRGRNRLA